MIAPDYCYPIVAEKERRALYELAELGLLDHVGPDGIRHRCDYVDDSGRRWLYDLVAVTSQLAVDQRNLTEFDPSTVIHVLALPVLEHRPPHALMHAGDLVAGMVAPDDFAETLAKVEKCCRDSSRVWTHVGRYPSPSGDFLRIEHWSKVQPVVHALILQFLPAHNAYGNGRFYRREPQSLVRGWYVINPGEYYLEEQIDPALEFAGRHPRTNARPELLQTAEALMQKHHLAPADVEITLRMHTNLSDETVTAVVGDVTADMTRALWEGDPK